MKACLVDRTHEFFKRVRDKVVRGWRGSFQEQVERRRKGAGNEGEDVQGHSSKGLRCLHAAQGKNKNLEKLQDELRQIDANMSRRYRGAILGNGKEKMSRT